MQTAVVETTHGKVRGGSDRGVDHFKGVPYGDTTAGGNRFLLPQPVRPWTGIQEAVAYGARAPQKDRPVKPANAWIRSDTPTGEDCLVLNVFTPSATDGGKRPVMVWLHGGGYNAGSGDAPGLDGTNLAKIGDVVVVTLNHRLNAFGYSTLAGLDDARYADSGNAGMLDIVAALEWVRDNISAFGGDAGNVTIFGQSGGGSKVAVLMTMAAAKGLFHKAIIQSASSHLRLATPDHAARAGRCLMEALGLDASTASAIHDVPADRLLAAYDAAVAARNGNDSFRPVVDGRSILNNPFDLDAPDLAADVPLMIGSCETEKSFYDITADPKTLPLSEDALRAHVMQFVGIGDGEAAALIAGYRENRPDAPARDIYNVISSDHMYRRNVIEAAEAKSRQGGAPAYLYEFTWKTPVLGGMLKSPHTLCIPFVFGTVEAAAEFVGTGPQQTALMQRTMGAWLAFARTGDPNHPGLPAWKPYNAETRPTMIFDNDCALAEDPKRDDRIRIGSCPRFISDQQFPEAA
jgi:para-nitrobenzyl esterase